ncbi:MAG: hypothetical protein WCG23_10085 [bacterium]
MEKIGKHLSQIPSFTGQGNKKNEVAVATATQQAITNAEKVAVSTGHVCGQDLVQAKTLKIQPGSEILNRAVPIESKPNPANFTLATTTGEVPDVWSQAGANHSYKPGQIVMNYGEQPLEYVSNPKVLEEAKAKGLSTVPDRAVGDYDIMHDTYIRKDTGKYLRETPMKPGDPPIDVVKKAKGGVLVMPNGTEVHTLETIAANKPPVTITTGNVIMLDHKGNPYVGDIEKVFVKKNVPTSPKAEKLFEAAQKFIETRKQAMKELGEEAKPAIEAAWKTLVKTAKKIKP